MDKDRSVHALNSTSVDRQNILRFRSVQKLTDCSIGGFDCAAVDHGFRISTFAIGQIVNGISHIGSAQVFNRAVFDHKLSTRIIRNHNGRSRNFSVMIRNQRNLAVTRNGKFASVIKQIKVARNIIVGTCNRFTIEVKRYFLGVFDRFGKRNICQERDGFAILCRFKCFREGCVKFLIHHCTGFQNAVLIVSIFAESQSICNQSRIRAFLCRSAELTTFDNPLKSGRIGYTDLGGKHTARNFSVRNCIFLTRIGHKNGRTIIARGSKYTSRNFKRYVSLIGLQPNLPLEFSSVDDEVSLIDTDRTVSRCGNDTSVDGHIAVRLMNSAIHMHIGLSVSLILRTQIFNRAVFNHQNTAIDDRIRAPAECGIACSDVLKGNLTVSRDRQVPLVLNHAVMSGTCFFLADRFSVQVKRYFLSIFDRFGKRNIRQKRDDFTTLCRFKCFREGFIFFIADLCDPDKIFTLRICRLRTYTHHAE